jgi:hypothetical protein
MTTNRTDTDMTTDRTDMGFAIKLDMYMRQYHDDQKDTKEAQAYTAGEIIMFLVSNHADMDDPFLVNAITLYKSMLEEQVRLKEHLDLVTEQYNHFVCEQQTIELLKKEGEKIDHIQIDEKDAVGTVEAFTDAEKKRDAHDEEIEKHVYKIINELYKMWLSH